MTARQAWGMGIDGVRFTLVTPEDRPLAMFGAPASEAVARAARRPTPSTSSAPRTRASGAAIVIADPGGRRIDADRVVALPALGGRGVEGVPADGDGFIPVDAHGRVPGLPASTPRATARTSRSSRAASRPSRPTPWPRRSRPRSGADVEPEPFRPVLRGLLLTGGDDRYFRHAVAGGGGEGEVAGHTLWWPPTKIAGRYLSAYLFESRRGPDASRTSAPATSRSSSRSTRMPPPGAPSDSMARTPPPPPEVCDALGVDAARARLERTGRATPRRPAARCGRGPTSSGSEPAPSRLALVARQFGNSMVLLLVGAAAISLAIGELLDAGVILAIVVANAALRRRPGGAGGPGGRRGARAARADRARAARRPRARAPRRGASSPGDSSRSAPAIASPADGRLVEQHAAAGRRVGADRRVAADRQARRPARSRRRAARRAPHHGARRHDRHRGAPAASSSPPPAPRTEMGRIAGAAGAAPRAHAAAGPPRPAHPAPDPDRGRHLRHARTARLPPGRHARPQRARRRVARGRRAAGGPAGGRDDHARAEHAPDGRARARSCAGWPRSRRSARRPSSAATRPAR